MKFWDSSALVPLLAAQAHTPFAEALFHDDPQLVVWWGSPVECASAIARLDREGGIAPPATRAALERLRALGGVWDEVQPIPRVREIAQRLLRAHLLRAGDALQLAAALVTAAEQPADLSFVCLDRRLAEAADREGFAVVGP
jgi:predicted nucleic acid-binding protein